MIRKAKISEIAELLTVTKACAEYMISQGIFQWNEHYPSKEAFIKDVERDELYILLEDNRIIGGVVISDLMDEEYFLLIG